MDQTKISDSIKYKRDILRLWAGNECPLLKQLLSKTEGLAVNSVNYKWFCRAKANNISESGPLIHEKFLEVATNLGLDEFKVSGRWLNIFCLKLYFKQ